MTAIYLRDSNKYKAHRASEEWLRSTRQCQDREASADNEADPHNTTITFTFGDAVFRNTQVGMDLELADLIPREIATLNEYFVDSQIASPFL